MKSWYDCWLLHRFSIHLLLFSLLNPWMCCLYYTKCGIFIVIHLCMRHSFLTRKQFYPELHIVNWNSSHAKWNRTKNEIQLNGLKIFQFAQIMRCTQQERVTRLKGTSRWDECISVCLILHTWYIQIEQFQMGIGEKRVNCVCICFTSIVHIRY